MVKMHYLSLKRCNSAENFHIRNFEFTMFDKHTVNVTQISK